MKDFIKERGIIVGGIALVALIIIFAVIYNRAIHNTEAGRKSVSVEIVLADGTAKRVELKSCAEFLRGALEEQNLIAGEEGNGMLFIKTVDGVTADESLQQWWCITKGGEDVYTGVDETPIKEGDHFEIVLKTGW